MSQHRHLGWLIVFGALHFGLLPADIFIAKENSPYFTHKKNILQERVLHFAAQNQQNNLGLFSQLFLESKKSQEKELLRKVEENLVVAQMLAEESPEFADLQKQDPKKFFLCLLLASLENQQAGTTNFGTITRRKSRKILTLFNFGLASLGVLVLYLMCKFLLRKNNLPWRPWLASILGKENSGQPPADLFQKNCAGFDTLAQKTQSLPK